MRFGVIGGFHALKNTQFVSQNIWLHTFIYICICLCGNIHFYSNTNTHALTPTYFNKNLRPNNDARHSLTRSFHRFHWVNWFCGLTPCRCESMNVSMIQQHECFAATQSWLFTRPKFPHTFEIYIYIQINIECSYKLFDQYLSIRMVVFFLG